MKEKLLLSFGIVCILIGAMGISAVGVAYYYTDSALNELSFDVEWLLLGPTKKTTTDVATVVYNVSVLIGTAANDLENIPLVGGLFFGDAADSLHEAAFSLGEVGANISAVSGDLEELKNIMVDEISSIRLTAQVTFGWIGVLHVLFIVIGVSILHIRKSLQSYSVKEKLLLSFGIVCILFGAIGVCAVGAAYYYTDSALNELPNDIEQLYAVTSQTTNDVASLVYNVGGCAKFVAYFLRTSRDPVFGGHFGDTAAGLDVTSDLILQLGDDVIMVNGYLEDLKNILLDEISSIRLAIQMTLGSIGVLHALFIVIGVSLLRIRKSLQSVIDRNTT